MQKLVQLDPFTEEGEPRVQVVHPGERVKTASEAMAYVETVKPEEGYTFVLVLAMSAGEFYGSNRNGDAFAENPIPGIVEEGQTLKDHYKTFESLAHVYKHHMNKDPNKSIGSVVKAFYNDAMHRVELLLKLDNQKAADIIAKLDAGKFPAVSMGCKIKYDVCSRRGCHKRAKTRAEYCSHAMFNMKKLDPTTGEQNFVWNPSPQLFDISFVIKPADRIGYTMKKVADIVDVAASSALLAEQTDFLKVSAEEFAKLSELDKYIRGYSMSHSPKANGPAETGVLQRVLKGMESFPDSLCELLSAFPTQELMSSLTSKGINPTTKEVLSIASHKLNLPEGVRMRIRRRSSVIAPATLNLLKYYPELIPAFAESEWLPRPDMVKKSIVIVVKPMMEKRSTVKEYLHRRALTPLSGGAVPPPNNSLGLHQLYDIDVDGERLRTTRGALETAQDNALERNALLGLGSAGGALGLYKLLTMTSPGKALFPLALLGSAAAGKAVYDTAKTPYFEGTDVPVNTEVTKMSSETSYLDRVVTLANEYNDASLPYAEQIKEANAAILDFEPHNDAAVLIKKLAADIDPRGQGHEIDQLIKESGLSSYPLTNEIDFSRINDIKVYLGKGIANN